MSTLLGHLLIRGRENLRSGDDVFSMAVTGMSCQKRMPLLGIAAQTGIVHHDQLILQQQPVCLPLQADPFTIIDTAQMAVGVFFLWTVIPQRPQGIRQVVLLGPGLFDQIDAVDRLMPRVSQNVERQTIREGGLIVIVLPAAFSKGDHLAPGAWTQLIELAAFSFPKNVKAILIRTPAAIHVPDNEIHGRMAKVVEFQGMGEQPENQNPKITGQEDVGYPSLHVDVLIYRRGHPCDVEYRQKMPMAESYPAKLRAGQYRSLNVLLLKKVKFARKG